MKLTGNILLGPILENGGLGKFNFKKRLSDHRIPHSMKFKNFLELEGCRGLVV